MNYKSLLYLLLFVISRQVCHAQVKNEYVITSPDKKTAIHIGVAGDQVLKYQISFNDQTVIDWSAMGLDINKADIGHGVSIKGEIESKHREVIDWPLGESAQIINNYNEAKLSCVAGGYNFDIIARVFDGSVAFKYAVKSGGQGQSFTLKNELTEYNLSSPATIYQYHEESVFRPMAINTLTTCDFPATVVMPNYLYLSIGEANNRGYTKCQLIKGKAANSLALMFYVDTIYRNHQVSAIHKDTLVRFTGDFETPWRTVSVAQSAVGLHDFSQLYLKLVDPAAESPLGVKPGKLFRSQLNTQSGLDCIDFAAKHNMQYIMFDAGWYGAEFRTISDPTKPIDAIDMPQVIAYGKQKGIGVILYVNYVGLRAKIDSILPVFKKWGVSGIKFGFVDGGMQNGLSWLDTAMRKVNDYGFIFDIHDHYKPTGLSRRYPFNLTQEGIRGDENSPDAFHTLTLPFTRFIAGPADFTFCYPNSKNNYAKNLKVSMGQQLALTVVYFSPLQSMFWYGRPNDYTNEEEIEFFKYVPTVWDESRYLAGEISQYISVARRKGNTWFIGNAAGPTDWKQDLKLDFLTKGKIYKATIYEDDGDNSIRKRTEKVRQNDILKIDIKAKGGQAIMITPAT